MTHPRRRPFENSRAYRMIPVRETLIATDGREQQLAVISDCNDLPLLQGEQTQTVELNTASKAWNLPKLVCREQEYQPKPKNLLKTNGGEIWEIRSVQETPDLLFWACSCIRLGVHVPE